MFYTDFSSDKIVGLSKVNLSCIQLKSRNKILAIHRFYAEVKVCVCTQGFMLASDDTADTVGVLTSLLPRLWRGRRRWRCMIWVDHSQGPVYGNGDGGVPALQYQTICGNLRIHNTLG